MVSHSDNHLRMSIQMQILLAVVSATLIIHQQCTKIERKWRRHASLLSFIWRQGWPELYCKNTPSHSAQKGPIRAFFGQNKPWRQLCNQTFFLSQTCHFSSENGYKLPIKIIFFGDAHEEHRFTVENFAIWARMWVLQEIEIGNLNLRI